jgi:putative membrane protein
MPPHMHETWEAWDLPVSLTLAFVSMALVYVRGWFCLRSTSSRTTGGLRALGFLLGLLLVWLAVASPLASCDAELLTLHMVQHLLLMSLGPPLIWLGDPVRPLLCGLPWSAARSVVVPLLRKWRVSPLGGLLGNPAVCWLAATGTLVGWHVPALFTLGMQSETWRAIEHASFLVTGLLFWWPVVRPWPASSTEPGWSIVLYLFLATLPCDILSGFLLFSERVAYPVYLSTPGHSNLSVLEDQQYAGALMWTAVTIIYLAAGVIVTMRLLSASRLPFRNPPSLEGV